MSQHHGHYIRRSDSYKKPVEVATSDPILQSNTAIQVITDSPRHRFHRDVLAHTVAGRVDNARAFRVRMQGASRPALTSVRKPAKTEFLEYP